MSGIATTPCKQSSFGPTRTTKHDVMGIRYLMPLDDNAGGAGGGGGAGEGGKPDDKGGADDKYTPPASQADLDRIVSERLARERSKFSNYDQLKKDSEELEKLRKETQSETEKAIEKAREEGRTEVQTVLTAERVKHALDKALSGRTLNSPSVLLDLDRTQFVKDGAVDADAVKTWVDANSAEASKQQPKDRSQGGRDANAGSGSVSAGRDLYTERKSSKKAS